MLSALEHRSTASAGEHHRPAPWRGSVVHDAAPSSSIMRRTRSGRADRRSNWRRVAPRSSVAGSVAPSRGEREPSRRRSPQPPAASRQPYSRTAVSRQLAVAVAAAAAAAVLTCSSRLRPIKSSSGCQFESRWDRGSTGSMRQNGLRMVNKYNGRRSHGWVPAPVCNTRVTKIFKYLHGEVANSKQ